MKLNSSSSALFGIWSLSLDLQPKMVVVLLSITLVSFQRVWKVNDAAVSKLYLGVSVRDHDTMSEYHYGTCCVSNYCWRSQKESVFSANLVKPSDPCKAPADICWSFGGMLSMIMQHIFCCVWCLISRPCASKPAQYPTIFGKCFQGASDNLKCHFF